MWGNSISARIKKAIKHRVVEAQKEHDAEVILIQQRAELDKEDHAEKMVDRIIGNK